MEFNEDTVASLAQEIWASMLGIDLVPGVGTEMGPAERTLTGCVQISGTWAGAVTVKCPSAAAQAFAGVMFDCDPATLSTEEVCDALGELTNMMGGSIKGLVEGDATLGIPAVAEGVEYRLSIPRALAVVDVTLLNGDLPVEIVVHEVKS